MNQQEVVVASRMVEFDPKKKSQMTRRKAIKLLGVSGASLPLMLSLPTKEAEGSGLLLGLLGSALLGGWMASTALNLYKLALFDGDENSGRMLGYWDKNIHLFRGRHRGYGNVVDDPGIDRKLTNVLGQKNNLIINPPNNNVNNLPAVLPTININKLQIQFIKFGAIARSPYGQSHFIPWAALNPILYFNSPRDIEPGVISVRDYNLLQESVKKTGKPPQHVGFEETGAPKGIIDKPKGKDYFEQDYENGVLKIHKDLIEQQPSFSDDGKRLINKNQLIKFSPYP